jgi:hypothetical protein
MVDFSFGNSPKGFELGKKLKEKFPNISFGLDSEILVCDLKEEQYKEALDLLLESGLGNTIWNKDMIEIFNARQLNNSSDLFDDLDWYYGKD